MNEEIHVKQEFKEEPKNELLSTPEGPPLPPESNNLEDLKLHELLSTFPNQQTPTLISPKNAELLIPTTSKGISNGTENTSGNISMDFAKKMGMLQCPIE